MPDVSVFQSLLDIDTVIADKVASIDSKTPELVGGNVPVADSAATAELEAILAALQAGTPIPDASILALIEAFGGTNPAGNASLNGTPFGIQNGTFVESGGNLILTITPTGGNLQGAAISLAQFAPATSILRMWFHIDNPGNLGGGSIWAGVSDVNINSISDLGNVKHTNGFALNNYDNTIGVIGSISGPGDGGIVIQSVAPAAGMDLVYYVDLVTGRAAAYSPNGTAHTGLEVTAGVWRGGPVRLVIGANTNVNSNTPVVIECRAGLPAGWVDIPGWGNASDLFSTAPTTSYILREILDALVAGQAAALVQLEDINAKVPELVGGNVPVAVENAVTVQQSDPGELQVGSHQAGGWAVQLTDANGLNIAAIKQPGTPIQGSDYSLVTASVIQGPSTADDGSYVAAKVTPAGGLYVALTGYGVAGTPSTSVSSIQGVAGGTAVPVSGSVSGSGNFTVVQPTGTNLHVVVDSGTVGVTGSVAVTGSFYQATQPVSIATAPALVASSAIIGKVGIDQTAPGTTNGVQVNAALPAGTNLLGKTGIDQTTDGTTNKVYVGNTVAGNVTQFGGSAVVTGVGNSGAGIPRVTVSSDSIINAIQSGAYNITNISGTISLPTGASTAAKQPALGTAGASSADVLTVQGVASMTPLFVGGAAAVGAAPTANPVPVSGVDGGGLKRAFLMETTGTLLLTPNVANAAAVKVTDGTSTMAVKAASTLPAAIDPAAVVTIRDTATIKGDGTAASPSTAVLSVQAPAPAAANTGAYTNASALPIALTQNTLNSSGGQCSITLAGTFTGVSTAFTYTDIAGNSFPLLMTAPQNSGYSAATGTTTTSTAIKYEATLPLDVVSVTCTVNAVATGTLNVRVSTGLGIVNQAVQNVAIVGVGSPADSATPSGNSAPTNTFPSSYDGSNWNRQRGNAGATITASGTISGAGTTNSATRTNYNGKGVILYINVTAFSGTTPTLTVGLRAIDNLSGSAASITGAITGTITGTGLTILMLYPGLTAVANSAINSVLPWKYGTQYVLGGVSPSFTFSVTEQVML